MKGDREKYIVAGMDDYVAKPINTPLLSEGLIKATGMALNFRKQAGCRTGCEPDDIAADAQTILNDFDSILEE
jgi:CheY-like chemotaxis protein